MSRLLSILLVLFILPQVGFAKSRPETIFKKIRGASLAVLQDAYHSERAFLRAAAARAAGESQDLDLLPLLNKATEDVYPTARYLLYRGFKRYPVPMH